VTRRAPRAVRRGRKFRGRPTSHDGLSVIFAYGNRWDTSSWERRIFGRMGNSEVVCADGYVLSVIAGHKTFCKPQPGTAYPGCDPAVAAPEDYRAPYTHVEILGRAEKRFPFDPEFDGDPWGYVPVQLVRDLVDVHGGFARMRQVDQRLVRRYSDAVAARKGAPW
jgi:hypothetical protein